MIASLALYFVALDQKAPKAADLVGTYQVKMSMNKSDPPVAQDPKTTPPGQIRTFVISNNHWILHDFMTGFEGTIKIVGNTVELWQTSGSTGDLKKPERMVFRFSKPCTLTMQPTKEFPGQIVYVRTNPLPEITFSNGSWH